MKRTVAILLAFNVMLILSWRLFLSNDKIDLFLFYELEQTPRWYAYYTSVYIRELILFIIIRILVPPSWYYIKTLSLFLIIMTISRLIIYWLFNSSINLEVQVACIVTYLILSTIKWQRLR